LPAVNQYVPKDLKMKSLCEIDSPKKQLRRGHRNLLPPRESLLEIIDPYVHLGRTEIEEEDVLEEDVKYQHRLNSFVETEHSSPFVFSSREECLKHEHEYEKYNKFPQLIKKDI
jgi:hypothetical protein